MVLKTLDEVVKTIVKEKQNFERLEMKKSDLLEMFKYNEFKVRYNMNAFIFLSIFLFLYLCKKMGLIFLHSVNIAVFSRCGFWMRKWRPRQQLYTRKCSLLQSYCFSCNFRELSNFSTKKKHLYNWPLFCRRTCTVRVTSRKNKEMKRRNIMGRQRDRGDSLFPLYSQTFLVQFFFKAWLWST